MRPVGLFALASVLAVAVVAGAADPQDTRPLPSTDALYRAVRENLLRAERTAQFYAFKERRTDVHTNPFGRIGTGGTRVFDVYPSLNRQLTYRRLLERDGVPLTPAELGEQDREYRRHVEDVRRRLATRPTNERRREDAAVLRDQERRQRRVEDIADTLRFTIERRTRLDGVSAIAVSFEPRPGARPETREGRLAVNFRGTLWVDEVAAEVMRVEGTSVDDITFGFGLAARVGQGAQASMTRRPVADGLWMPVQVTLKGRGRAVVVRPLVIDFVVDWFDYRLLNGRTDAPFLE